MKKKIRRRGALRWCVAGAGVIVAGAAFALWGPHASAEWADASGVAAEWRAWREAEDKAGFEAWDALRSAGERLEEHGRARFGGNREGLTLALDRLLTGSWDDPRHDEDREELGDTSAIVEEILASADRPWGSWRQSPERAGDALGEFVGASVPSGVSERQRMAELLRVSMRDAAARGDWEGVERLTRGHLRLARHSFAGAGSMALMTAVSQWGLGVEECVRLCVEEEAPREACERLARVIEEGRLPVDLLSRTVKGDRLLQLGMARTRYNRHGLWMMWSDELAGEGPILLPVGMMEGASVWDRVSNVRAYVEPRLVAADGAIAEATDLLEGWLEAMGSREHWKGLRTLGRPVEVSGAGPGSGPGEFGRASRVNRAMVRMWLDVGQTERGALAALKVAGWKAEKGEWPRGLEEVLSKEERENPATGGEFVYVQGEEAGGGFWLMAVGLEEWKMGSWRGGMWRHAYREREKEWE